MATKNSANLTITKLSSGAKLERAGTADGQIEAAMRAIVQNAAFGLTSGTGVQTAFPNTCDVWTLEGNTTYKVRFKYLITTGTTTTKTTAIAFAAGGGLTITNMAIDVIAANAVANTTVTAQNRTRVTQLASTVVTATSTTGGVIIEGEGYIRVNVGGTITPKINFSAAPGATCQMDINSFIEFIPVGSGTFEKYGSVA